MVSEIDTREKSFSGVFGEYWLDKAGYKNDADIWKANLGIAEAHRLALYRGKLGHDLVRAYP